MNTPGNYPLVTTGKHGLAVSIHRFLPIGPFYSAGIGPFHPTLTELNTLDAGMAYSFVYSSLSWAFDTSISVLSSRNSQNFCYILVFWLSDRPR